MIASVIWSASIRGAAVFIAFILTAVVTRGLGADQAGLFLLGFGVLAAASVFFRLGLDNVLVRSIAAHDLESVAQQTVNRAWRWVVLVVVPAALLIAVLHQWLAATVFGKPDFAPVLFWIAVALPFVTLFNLFSFAFQGQQRVVLATLFQNLAQGMVFVALFGLLWWQKPEWLSAGTAAAVYAIVAMSVLLLASVAWFGQKAVTWRLPAGSELKDRELWKASSNLWAAASMSLLVQWSGVLIAGAMVAAADLAYLSAAQRTAGVTSFVLMVVNMAVAPRYARLWKEEKISEIRRLAKLSTRAMVLMVLPVIALMLVYPDWIMKLFGEGFEQGAVLLMIMAVGQFINVATGSVGYLLNMSGHERDFRRVTLFAGPLTIVCAVGLTWQWGALGAAIATAIGVSVQNLGALWMVRKRLGFWPLG